MKTKTREKNESKPPTEGQLKALGKAGIQTSPDSRLAAQKLLSQHFRSRSKRGRNGRKAARNKERNDAKVQSIRRAASR